MNDKPSIELMKGQIKDIPTEVCELIAEYSFSIIKTGDLVDFNDGFSWYLGQVLEVSQEVENKVLIHYSTICGKWVSLSEGRISRIYSPQDQMTSLNSIQVGDTVDRIIGDRNLIYECTVVDDNETHIKLKVCDLSCSLPYCFCKKELWEVKSTDRIIRISEDTCRMIGSRNVLHF
jgi:hypothetical protein